MHHFFYFLQSDKFTQSLVFIFKKLNLQSHQKNITFKIMKIIFNIYKKFRNIYLVILKNFSYLIDVYKKTKEDEKLFISNQSIHWDSYYKENKKFYNLDNLINFRKIKFYQKV